MSGPAGVIGRFTHDFGARSPTVREGSFLEVSAQNQGNDA
jgi:hypothetical protein